MGIMEKAISKKLSAKKAAASCPFTVAVACAVITLLAIVDYNIKTEYYFALFYLIPIMAVAWKVGLAGGAVSSMAATGALFACDSAAMSHPGVPVLVWNTFARLVVFLIVCYILSVLRKALHHEKTISRTDPVTGINNSRLFYESAQTVIETMRANSHPVSLAYIDIDNFKAVNDTFGHIVGDGLLRIIANIARENIRKTDCIARLGGDEFAILLPGSDEKTAIAVIERIRTKLTSFSIGNGWPISFSIGLITFLAPPKSVNDMIKEADTVMYEVKAAGKNSLKSLVCPVDRN